MPSTIPYDPSLVIGNLVTQSKLDALTDLSKIQQPADAAEDNLNKLISLKRSTDMTIMELTNMKISTKEDDFKELFKQSEDLKKQILKAAKDYTAKKAKSIEAFAKKDTAAKVNSSLESPVDYVQSSIKKMPLSSDSLKLNAQYFSAASMSQKGVTVASAVAGFVSQESSFLGSQYSSQMSASAQSQVNSQYSRHDIEGTLVLSVTCTHKDAALLAPCVIDVDKAINVWNALYTSDQLDPENPAAVAAAAKIAAAVGKKENALSIISGATYGSSFVGMVHILKVSETRTSEAMVSMAASVQEQFKMGAFFAKMSGGYGVSSSFSADIKSLLSNTSVQAHCTLNTVGSIPSLKSNTVKMAVQQFAKFDGASSMNQIASLQNATASDKDTMDASADAARKGGQMIAMKNAKIKGVLEGLSTIDETENKVLDINSMMTALDDYVEKALAGNLGVPINYYIKPITKLELAKMWVKKYYGGKYEEPKKEESGNDPA